MNRSMNGTVATAGALTPMRSYLSTATTAFLLPVALRRAFGIDEQVSVADLICRRAGDLDRRSQHLKER